MQWRQSDFTREGTETGRCSVGVIYNLFIEEALYRTAGQHRGAHLATRFTPTRFTPLVRHQREGLGMKKEKRDIREVCIGKDVRNMGPRCVPANVFFMFLGCKTLVDSTHVVQYTSGYQSQVPFHK